MGRWFPWRPRGIVRRLSDQSLWHADGASPLPIDGWNFRRLERARLGWRHGTERWITRDSRDFEIVRGA